jgi:superfamily II DNA or RNA helicase
VEIPTGGGKTIIVKEIAARVSHLQILVITPRKKLLKQFQASLPPNVGIMSSLYGNDDGSAHDLVLATNQTLISRSVIHPMRNRTDYPTATNLARQHFVRNESHSTSAAG